MLTRPLGLLIPLIVAQVLAMAGFANFAVLVPEFTALWSLSNTQAGWIGGIFFAGYVLAVPVLVGLTDVIDAKRVYLVGVLFGLVGSFGFSCYADGFWTAMFFRLLAGVSLAGTYMPGLQILNDRVGEGYRQRAMPWYLGTVSIGTGLSFYLTGQLVDMLEWPYIFVVAGLSQTICFVMVFFTVPRKHKAPRSARQGRHPLDFRPVFRNRTALAYILGYTGHSFELFAFRAWIIAFMVFVAVSQGAPVGRAELGGYVAAFSIFGMFASIFGAEIAYRGRRDSVVKVVMGLSFLTGGMLGFLSGLPFVVFVVITGVYSGLLLGDSAALTAGTVEAAPDGERGATLAMHSVFGFSGGFLGPLVVGLVLDLAGGQESYVGWAFACLTMASGSLIALLLLRFTLGKTR